MRVAIFTNTFFPTLNGVANCVAGYRRGLESRGHEVHVFAPCPHEYDPESDPPNIHRFPAIAMPGDWDYDLAVPYSRPVIAALRDVEFDIVHTQHPMWVGVWGAWYARWNSLPLVTTAHTEYEIYARLLPLPEPLVESYVRHRVVAYCNKCQLVTTPVQSARERLEADGVETPIELLANPINLSELPVPDRTRVRRAHGLSDDELVMGFIGRLVPEKNLETVLSAAAIVMRATPRARFLLVGDGGAVKGLRAHVQELGIADRVIFTGAVGHTEVPHYQAALDAFMTASLSETQPLAYTEAMAIGTPVVAVRAPGARDMIADGENGLLADPDDAVAGLAAAVTRLVHGPALRAGIVERAKQHVLQYDLPAVTDRLLDIYALACERLQTAEE